MGAPSFRARLGFAAIFVALLGFHAPVQAQGCPSICARGAAVCAMQAQTARAACAQACAPGDVACRTGCMTAFRAARASCQATRGDCGTTCPAPAEASGTCSQDCSATAQTCFADAFSNGADCLKSCLEPGSARPKNCLAQCVSGMSHRGPCMAAFQTCLSNCRGQVTGNCFNTTATACTTEACGPGQPCSGPDEFCSERCAAAPANGACVDLATRQCTGQTCSPTEPCAAGQACLPACPPPVPQGHCFDPATKTCGDESCDAARPCADGQLCTLQCPVGTPTPQCASVPCGGPCVISPICLPGQPCPKFPSRPGECAIDANGECGCGTAPPRPTSTPRPTPTPECDANACAGPCTFRGPIPCPPGKICNGPDLPLRSGQCTTTDSGACECVPVSPTPPSTPTPQCDANACGGPCTLRRPMPCPPGKICNGPDLPLRSGQCTTTDSGACECVPVSPTPPSTPTPQCDVNACGGPCTLRGPIPCPRGKDCNGFDQPLRSGQCTTTDSGACECIPVSPTPPTTPTPQCGGPVCGGPCVIRPSCAPGQICPQWESIARRGTCADDAAGVCRCVPVEEPTPQCAGDADCDDGNGCTADRCVNGECQHACICASPNGAPNCCAGPSNDCVRPCGTDAAGSCGGACPLGATCEASAAAAGSCGCVSGPGGPCGGNILAVPPVCAPGLVCHQSAPDAAGYCEKPDCVPLFMSGCSDTSDCCQPCENGTRAPCGVCINGTCDGAP